MNQVASYLADRKELQGAIQNERLKADRSGNKEVNTSKKWIRVARSLLGKAGVYGTDYVPGADQVITD